MRGGNELEDPSVGRTLGRCNLPQRSSLKSPAPCFQLSFRAAPNNSPRPAPEEEKLFISLGKENQFIVTLTPDMALKLGAFSSTSEQLLLVCFGRVGPSRWFSGDNWGQSYSRDVCGDLRAWALPGLGSSLRVQRNGAPRKAGFAMAVNPGLLHLSAIQFREVSFLEGCQEFVFEAGESVYLIDLEQKRLGTVANGERFILLTSRYRKHL